jgi:hypothetical protein
LLRLCSMSGVVTKRQRAGLLSPGKQVLQLHQEQSTVLIERRLHPAARLL